VGDSRQDKGARRGAEAVDDHWLARRVQALKLANVIPDPTAPIARYADCRVTGPHVREQQRRGKQTG